MAKLLRSAGARVLVTLGPTPVADDLWSRISPHLAGLPDLRCVVLVSAAPYVEGGDAEVLRSLASQARIDNPAITLVDFRSELAKYDADRLALDLEAGPQDPSSYFCTGGTTGVPKIAVRTQGNEVFDAWAVGNMLGVSPKPRTYFCGLPLFHVNAQLVTGLLPWMFGDHVVIGTPEGFRGKGVIANFWRIVSHYRISMFSGVPTLYAALLESPVGDSDLSSLEFAICGAAPMPTKLIQSFEEKIGLKILEGYGLTEGACVSSVNPPAGERRAGSIGLRIPYQKMKAVILDVRGRFLRQAARDEVGIIVLRGPNIFTGYLHSDYSDGLWIDIDGEPWLNTGDLGRRDADGYFWLSGRQKELIIRSGHNIDPKIIEEALCRHPAVALAAAVGSPDPHAGEVPVAFVQVKPGTAVSEQELLDLAAETIPERAAIPKRIRICPALPMTAVGKISKPALRQQLVEETIRHAADDIGVAVRAVSFERDSKRGDVARVHAVGDLNALGDALGRYAFKADVIPAAASGLH